MHRNTGRLCKQPGSSPGAKPVKTEFFRRVIFSSLPLSPVLKQVCCCFHNLGEEIKPLSAGTLGAKPNRSTDTPSWLPVPEWRRPDGKFAGDLGSTVPRDPCSPGPSLGHAAGCRRSSALLSGMCVASGAAGSEHRAPGVGRAPAYDLLNLHNNLPAAPLTREPPGSKRLE